MRASWLVRGGRDMRSAPFLIAGIVNVTPDSFSDGGMLHNTEKALAHCRQLYAQGADIIDIGGESTRPGAALISGEQERERVLPVVSGCRSIWSREGNGPLLAVDTWRAQTAQAALEQGADVINDISGASFDAAMPEVLAEYRPGYVLMHTPARPAEMQAHTAYENVVDSVMGFFERQMGLVTAAGLPESHIVLDPGIGFGKTSEQNLELMRSISRLQSLGRPLYIGISRKSFLGALLDLPVHERDGASSAASALLAQRGVWIHRVHNVLAVSQALRLEALMR